MNKVLSVFIALLVCLPLGFSQAYSGLPSGPAAPLQPIPYITWVSSNTTTFTGTAIYGIGAVLSSPAQINIQTVDMVLSVAPVGCTTPAIVTLYDATNRSAIVELDPQFEITLVNGQRYYSNDPPNPYTLTSNQSIIWGIKQAAVGCTTSPASPSWTVGYSMYSADTTVPPTPTGGGGTPTLTPVISIPKATPWSSTDATTYYDTDNAQYDKQICSTQACAGSGAGITAASATVSYGTVATPPAGLLTNLGMTVSLTTNAVTGETNALYIKHFSTCDSCTDFVNDFWMQPSTAAISYASSLESDNYLFDSTHGFRHMAGLQCNIAGGVWQIDNQDQSWINAVSNGSTVACALTAGTWYHITYHTHRVIGDTACTLATGAAGPCIYYDSLKIGVGAGAQVTYVLNQKMRASVIGTYASDSGTQKQIDMYTSGTAHTATALYMAESYTASK